MFGMRKKQPQQDAQIPYEVYETIQQPTVRRRAWVIRLIAALVIVTALILGGVWAKRTFLDDKKTPANGNSSQSTGKATDKPTQKGQNNQPEPPKTLVQQPQQNTALPAAGSPVQQPVTVPQSDTNNTSTVRKPE